MSAKDKKNKKKEQAAKLRQHVESAAAVKTLEPEDDNAVTHGSNGVQTAEQVQASRFLGTLHPAHGSSSGAPKGSQFREEDEEDEPNGNAIDDARMNRLGNTDDAGKAGAVATDANQAAADQATSGQPKRKKFRQEEMKLAMEKALGDQGVALLPYVDAHTGNAPEPFVCAQISSNKSYVPIPSHWAKVSAYLSEQNDRPLCNVIPDDIKATGVEYVRSGNNKQPDIAGFARAFLNGSPLLIKTHGVRLLDKGAAYEGARWKPSQSINPGVISERLRIALGMLTDKSPPPWLHSMQRVRTLPPSYPNAKYAGLNAPIPEGGQWGYSKGQWGEPVKKVDGTFLYPAAQSLGHVAAVAALNVANQAANPLPYGTVPPRKRAGASEPTAEAAASRLIPTIVNEDAKKAPVIQPMSFVPSTGIKPHGAVPVLQMGEYLRDLSTEEDDLVSVGARLVARGATAAQPITSYSVNLAPHY